VETYVGKDMLGNAQVMGYLEKRSFPNSLLSQILAWKEENQAEAEEAAYYFLENFDGVWGNWVPFDQKLDIQNSL
jgi:glycine betaine/proline transport system substrate-binding protein